MTVAESVLAELQTGPKSAAELRSRYNLSRNALERVMDTLGQTEPVYNPIPGIWAILGEDDDKMYQL